MDRDWSTGRTGANGALAFRKSAVPFFRVVGAQFTTSLIIQLRAADFRGSTRKMLDAMSTT